MKIRGINLGGWLNMEGYILGGRNIAESLLKWEFKKIYGKKELKEFELFFRSNFIKENDFKNIAAMGANVVRLPFSYRLLEEKPFCYSKRGLAFLEDAFRWAEKYGISVILDLHAAPGAQNEDWHSDSTGKALFWEKAEYRKRACAIWEVVADRFKGQRSLLGYDILNEPVLGEKSTDILKHFYKEALKRIRAIDKQHIIFLEGDVWAQRIDYLADLIEDKVSISVHTYAPLEYTFNFRPFYNFPGKIGGAFWDKNKIYEYLNQYRVFSLKNKVRIFVGEFGINWRGGSWGELKWLENILAVFNEFGFDYTYWTYKAMANSVFPDGIYQYIDNSRYIMREGPLYGWENYLKCWNKEKKHIVDFWQTKNFSPNNEIIRTLKRSFIEKA